MFCMDIFVHLRPLVASLENISATPPKTCLIFLFKNMCFWKNMNIALQRKKDYCKWV